MLSMIVLTQIRKQCQLQEHTCRARTELFSDVAVPRTTGFSTASSLKHTVQAFLDRFTTFWLRGGSWYCRVRGPW